MRWGVIWLLFGMAAVVGCAPEQSGKRVQERQQWQRVGEKFRGEVLLVDVDRGISSQQACPCSAVRNRGRAAVPGETTRSVLSAVVDIRITDRAGARQRLEGHSSDQGNARTASLRSRGTGIIIAADGLILTNDHVIRHAGNISVVLHDGSHHRAELVARDPWRDLAIIKISADELESLDPQVVGTLDVGEAVVALGGAGGESRRLGRIKRHGVSLQGQLDPSGRRYYGQLIETCAAIDPGFSGGPLLDGQGRLIGINVAVARDRETGELRGYAVPLNRRTRGIISRLAAGRSDAHGYLGAYIKDTGRQGDLSDADVPASGAVIVDICPDSPAAEAGLRAGDLIVSLGGEGVDSADHLVRLGDAAPIDHPVEIRYVRDNRLHRGTVRLRNRPQ